MKNKMERQKQYKAGLQIKRSQSAEGDAERKLPRLAKLLDDSFQVYLRERRPFLARIVRDYDNHER